MNEFKSYHPSVGFIYFSAITVLSAVVMHPVCIAEAFVCAFIYSAMLGGRKAVLFNLRLMPLFAAAVFVNTLFNHEGATIIAYYPSGNPLTAEALFYGIASAAMLVSVIMWFSCFGEVMTSDKLICLFGRAAPSLSLILSMTLRFIPRLRQYFREASNARKCVGTEQSGNKAVSRIRNSFSVFSAVFARAAENASVTADSMKCRGFGLPKRTSFTIYTYTLRDLAATAAVVLCAAAVVFCKLSGAVAWAYFPVFKAYAASSAPLLLYGALCAFPVIIELLGVIKWKLYRSKI